MIQLPTETWLGLFAVVLTPLIGLVKAMVSHVEARLPRNVYALVQDLVAEVVNGVAQMKLVNGWSGQDAKDEAMEAIETQLKSWHINVPAQTLSALIESAVRDVQSALTVAAPALASPTPAAAMLAPVQPQNTVTPGQTVTAPTVTPQQPQQDSPTTQIAALDAAGDNAKV